MNNFRSAICLLFEKQEDWQIVNYFPCAEVDSYEQTLRTITAEDSKYGKQTWLVVEGLSGSGSSMHTDDCVWYNLQTGVLELRYVPSMFRYQNIEALQYEMTAGVEVTQNEEGRLVLTVQNNYAFGNEAYFLPNGRSRDKAGIKQTETQVFDWYPGEQYRALHKNANTAEKVWLSKLDIEIDHEYNAYITVQPVDLEMQYIGRYAGYASAPRLDYLETEPTFTVLPGTEFMLGFNAYSPGYTLTRYDTITGEATPIPTRNHRFNAAGGEAAYLYTVEYTTDGGLNSYDFVIVTANSAPTPPSLAELTPDPHGETVEGALLEEKAIEMGLAHVKAITGYEMADTVYNAYAELRSNDAPYPDEWDIRLTPYAEPRMQFHVRMAAQNGNLTFYSCDYDNKTLWNSGNSIPITFAPNAPKDLKMQKLALYYYENLQVDDQGELRRTEYKRDVKNANGSVVTQIYVRFQSDNVFAIDFDKETRMPTWICVYYK